MWHQHLCHSPKYLGYLPTFPLCSLSSLHHILIFLYYTATALDFDQNGAVLKVKLAFVTRKGRIKRNGSSERYSSMAPLNSLSLNKGWVVLLWTDWNRSIRTWAVPALWWTLAFRHIFSVPLGSVIYHGVYPLMPLTLHGNAPCLPWSQKEKHDWPKWWLQSLTSLAPLIKIIIHCKSWESCWLERSSRQLWIWPSDVRGPPAMHKLCAEALKEQHLGRNILQILE